MSRVSANGQPTKASAKVVGVSALHSAKVDPIKEGESKGGEDDEEGDEKSNSSSEDEPPMKNPSRDIRGDLESAIKGSLNFKGTFAFKETYEDAPNPLLHLPKIGLIGVPLNEREAKAVIEQCEQAPFGKGERTIVDKSVRDTWELDGSKVRFDNPAWHQFLNRAVQDVCVALGVDYNVSKPRAELYKLLIYETGSHFLPHQDTEKVNGMFATVIVVLPSRFTGGEAHLSHGPLSAVYDCSATSNVQTTVMAWYTDVTHEIKPITSGYRFALSFNLIHTTNTLRPSLPSNHLIMKKLRHILLSWKQKVDPAPLKIMILLEHKYSQANLRGSALKGADAHKAALLEVLANELGFRILLASLEYHISGTADDFGPRSRNREFHCAYDDDYSDDDDDDDDDEDNISMGKVHEREMDVENVVDLDGNRVMACVNCADQGEMIPQTLRKDVESKPHDKQEYEGYQGNHGGSMDRWYRRTVLLLWPQYHNCEIEHGPEAMLAVLDAAKGSKPTKEEKCFTEYAFAALKGRRLSAEQVAKPMCIAAGTWGDLTLWNRAVEACDIENDVATLGADGILDAVECFGFEPIRPTIEIILKNESGNSDRYDLISELQANAPSPWIAEQRTLVVQTLSRPSKDQAALLVQMATDHGGVPCLTSTIYPQVQSLAGSDFRRHFAKCIYTQREAIATETSHAVELSQIITSLLTDAISMADFFQPAKVAKSRVRLYARPHSSPPPLPPSPALAARYIETCLATENHALVTSIVTKLTSVLDVNTTTAVTQSHTKAVLLPLIPLVEQMRLSQPTTAPPFPDIAPLCKTAIVYYINQIGKATPTQEDWSALITTVMVGGADLLQTTVIPMCATLPWNESVIREFIKQLEKYQPDIVKAGGDPESVKKSITVLVKRIVKTSDVKKLNSGGYPSSALGARIVAVLELCLDTDNVPCAALLFRVLQKSQTAPTQQGITSALIPALKTISQFLTRRNISVKWGPFASTCKWIVLAWAKHVLGPSPPDNDALLSTVTTIPCKCEPCMETIKFLTTGPDTQMSLSKIGATKRKHVEKHLTKYASGAATWSTIPGSPQGLLVTKSSTLLAPQKWREQQKKGLTILHDITTDNSILQTIFGDEFSNLYALLTEANPSPTVIASASTLTPQLATSAGPSDALQVVRVGAAATSATLGTVAQAPPSKKRKRSNV